MVELKLEAGRAESTKRSRSGQAGSAGSNFRNRLNKTVAISAAPMGKTGGPGFACSTASMASARIAFAMRSCRAREVMGVLERPVYVRGLADGAAVRRDRRSRLRRRGSRRRADGPKKV